MIQSADTEDNASAKGEQVVVRAVFINCGLDEEQNLNEIETTRFQREELFKHGALQGCHKKLALTVKIASEPENSSGDEYIPIEHVFDGSSNKKRARLLDPYILRLRRETPLQAYKLRRIDTVTGILTQSDDRSSKSKKSRVQRNLDELLERKDFQDLKESKDSSGKQQPLSITVELEENSQKINNHCGVDTNLSNPMVLLSPKEITSFGNKNYNESENIKDNTRIKRDACTSANNPTWKRDKRHEHNIIVEDITDDYKIPWTVSNRVYRRLDLASKSGGANIEETSNEGLEKIQVKKKIGKHNSMEPQVLTNTHLRSQAKSLQGLSSRDSYNKGNAEQTRDYQLIDESKETTKCTRQSYSLKEISTRRSLNKKNKNDNQNNNLETAEKNFVLYDIGNPDLLYTVNVQLFEKMSTTEGKTVWNDITKGEIARVSTFQPEWTDQDMNVRYKPMEWMGKDEFALPSASNLCLLAPLRDGDSVNVDDDVIGLKNNGRYIVVPKEDIVTLEDTESVLNKRDGNYSVTIPSDSNTRTQPGIRRVLVRVSRTLLTGNEEELKISIVGADRFLTLPHRRTHHAQIDLEARADENQLIRVGSAGSLITIVSDNSRKTRSVITVQATNKGLAAARFRVRARDCGPELASMFNEKTDGIIAGPILVPPRHTQRFQLELPVGMPVDTIHCSVALINDDEESVAVRDVAIKKGDRCFCVWHCDCVCLHVDPKLTCREMPEAHQTAAGLSARERTRRARSVCYPDCVTINLFVIVVGVLMTLLLLGLVKAFLGLFCRCVGKWGLHKLMQTPRKLERYFEPSLQGRAVVYDDEGWPIHPDTKKRTVRLISKSMEFILNLVIFIILPCLMLRDVVLQLACRTNLQRGKATSLGGEDKKCFSTHDMQTRPLLHERRGCVEDAQSSCADSEQDDTEYVLMQMQKSKESLARSQKRNTESGTSSTKKQIHPDPNVSKTITH